MSILSRVASLLRWVQQRNDKPLLLTDVVACIDEDRAKHLMLMSRVTKLRAQSKELERWSRVAQR